MSWTFATSGAAIAKAGSRANATISASGATLGAWADEAEAVICDTARIDLVTKYSSLTTNGKAILGMLQSSMVAQKIVGYDIGAYGSSREAETIMDVLENDIRRCLALITDDKVNKYLAAH